MNPRPPQPLPFSFLRGGSACQETQGPLPLSWKTLRVLGFYLSVEIFYPKMFFFQKSLFLLPEQRTP